MRISKVGILPYIFLYSLCSLTFFSVTSDACISSISDTVFWSPLNFMELEEPDVIKLSTPLTTKNSLVDLLRDLSKTSSRGGGLSLLCNFEKQVYPTHNKQVVAQLIAASISSHYPVAALLTDLRQFW